MRSFWQSSLWGEILSLSGQASEVFFFSRDGKKDSLDSDDVVLVEIRLVGLGMYGAFLLGGTLQDESIYHSLVLFLREKGIIFLQIEPLDGDCPFGKDSHYRSFIFPYTRVIDLTLPLDTILADMSEKGRYNIRLGMRRGVEVRKVALTPENIETFYRMVEETTERDGFAHNSRAYYEHFLIGLEHHNAGGLYFAFFRDTVIAASILVLTEERAIYYYGASVSDDAMRKQKGPEALQWQMIQDAKAFGSHVYDFLGVANPDDPHDSLQGVTRFKEKFGGTIVKFPSKKITILSWKGHIFLWIFSLKKYFKRIIHS